MHTQRRTLLLLLGSFVFTTFTFSVITFSSIADAADKNVPKVPFQFAMGKTKFQSNCALCHGKWGDGSKLGPPLMHAFYKPSHHSDAAFYRAARKGVRAHHWKFGDMPPIPAVTSKDMEQVIAFIRWLQRERGVYK